MTYLYTSPHPQLLQVSRTYEIIESLLEYERDVMSGNLSPSDIITVILSVNPVIEVCNISLHRDLKPTKKFKF